MLPLVVGVVLVSVVLVVSVPLVVEAAVGRRPRCRSWFAVVRHRSSSSYVVVVCHYL